MVLLGRGREVVTPEPLLLEPWKVLPLLDGLVEGRVLVLGRVEGRDWKVLLGRELDGREVVAGRVFEGRDW